MFLGWFDDNPKKAADVKIGEAINAYVERFKVAPNIVLVNEADRPIASLNVTVRVESYIRRNNFWIGWES